MSETTPLWTADEAAQATGGDAQGDWSVTGMCIDTREIQPGDMFVALKAARDGHEFVEAAFEGGASAALVSQDIGEKPRLVVHDTQKGLEALGLAARARSSAVHAAITGSVGKTSVKEMIAQIFRSSGPAHWSVKSFNNHWGVPLTLARMPRKTRRAIFEIGMNTPGEIAPRSRMVRPQIAMITRIAGAHLEGMGSIDAVADEKADIFAGLEEGGVAILPRDDAFFDYLKARAFDQQPTAQLLSFGGTDSGADARLLSFSASGDHSVGEADILGETVSFSVNAIGDHWGLNAILALLVGKLSGMSAQEAADALAGFTPPPGRGVAEQLVLPDGKTFTLLDDAYNANPESMRAGLAALGQRDGRKIAILGEMRELGPEADRFHAELATPIHDAGVKITVPTGSGMQPLVDELQSSGNEAGVLAASTAEDAIKIVKEVLMPGDVVLIKGSNASGIARVGKALRQWSDEVEGQMMGTQSQSGEA